MQKLWKRKTGLGVKAIFSKREEFFQKKYKRAISELLDAESPYFFQRHLVPENDYSKKRKTIKVDTKKLLDTADPGHLAEEEKLMQLLGIPEEKITERLKKYMKKTISQMVALESEENSKKLKKDETEHKDFMT